MQLHQTFEAASEDNPLKAKLEAHFGNVANFPDEESESDGHLFPDGSRSVECTNWMRYVRRLLGNRVKFYGFMDEDNPTSEIAKEAGGHDFAVVDDRYIVDGWVKHVSGSSNRAVFDMQDPIDQAVISRLYGDRNAWEPSRCMEKAIDDETSEKRAAYMRGFPSFTDQ